MGSGNLLIIDYLHLMIGSNPHYKNCTQEISRISRGLKGFAKNLGGHMASVISRIA